MKSIINGKIYYKGAFHQGKVLLYEEEIIDILEEGQYLEQISLGMACEEQDAKGTYVIPGFIDVHIHGYHGHDVMDADLKGLEAIAEGICHNGVTAFLPTTMTMSKDRIISALDTVAALRDKGSEGALVLGVHLEGPYINVERKGAQPGDYVALPENDLLEAYQDLIKVVTIAPEVPGAIDLIKTYANGLNFSLGHSSATYEEAVAAYEAGARGTTHLFNAMTGIHHREPGLTGASLSCDCYAEAIADKIHVNPGLYQMILRAKGLDKLLLITDCMRAGGLGDGDYSLGGQEVWVKEGKCTLEDGTIAGSVLKLNQGLRNFSEAVEETLEALIPLVTANQASYLKVSDVMGSLDKGKLANIVMMDAAFNINTTIVKGRSVYENHL